MAASSIVTRITEFTRRAGVAVLLALAVTTCRDAPMGPGGLRASLAVAPVMPMDANQLAAFGIAIDSLRVVVVRAPSDTVADTTVAFAADQDQIALALPVALDAASETLAVAIELRGTGFVLFAGASPVEVHAGPPGATIPPQIPLTYTGPGANVTSLVLSPLDSVVRLGDSLRFRVDAFAGQTPVTQFYVSWSSSDTVLAKPNAHGVLRAPTQRGAVTVTARTPTGVTGSTPITFVPVPTALLSAFTPTPVLPGASLGPLRVQVRAADNLGVKGIGVQFSAVSGGGSVTSSQVITDDGGFAETPATAGPASGLQVFRASVVGLTPVDFNVTVLSSGATQLAFQSQPQATTAGTVIGPVVIELRDAQGAVDPSATLPVTVALGANAAGATLAGTTTVNAVGGVATFADLTLTSAAAGYTLVASASGLTGAASGAFTIVPAATSALEITSYPPAVTAGIAFATPIIVEARDAFGNLTPSFTGAVNIALGANPAGGTLFGTTSTTALSGIASFAGLFIDNPGASYSLVASAPGLTDGTSGSIDVLPPVSGRFWVNASGGNWSAAANWSGGIVPGSNDTVFISLGGTYTVNLDVNDTVAYLFVGGSSGAQTFTATNRTLGIDSGAVFNPQTTLRLQSTTITTAPGAALSAAGTVDVAPGTSTIQGLLSVAGGGLLRLIGDNGSAALVASQGVANFGTVQLMGTSWGGQINVANAAFVNGPGATLYVQGGAGNALTGELQNHGAVAVDGPWQLAAASAATNHQNLGAITLASGGWTLNQPAGASFTTSGTVTVGAGTLLTVNGGTFDYASQAPGGVSGSGEILVSAGTLILHQDLAHDTLTLRLQSAMVDGPGTLTVAGSSTLLMSQSTINAPLVIAGSLQANPGTSGINGPLSVASAGTLRLVGNNGTAVLNVANGFVSNGAIELTGTSWGGQLTVGGTLTNSGNAVLRVLNGAGSSLNGALDNQGLVEVNGPWVVSGSSLAHANTGTITLGTGNWTLNQSGSGANLHQAGTVTVGAGRTWTVNGGTVNAQGDIGGAGRLQISGATLALGASLTHDTLTLALASSTVNGPGTLTVAGATTLTISQSVINAPLVNLGTVEASPGSSAFNGPFTNASGAILRLQGNNGNAALTVDSGFTNEGIVELTGTSWGGQLTVAGTLVNTTSGTLRVSGNAGNALTGTLENHGAVQVDAHFTLNGTALAHVNSGTIALGLGNWFVNQSGSGSFTTTGAVTVNAGRAWTVSGGALNYQGGTIGGTGQLSLTGATMTLDAALTHDTLTLALASSTVNGPGRLTVAGATTLTVSQSAINAPLVNLGTIQAAPGNSAINGPLTNATGALLRLLGNNGAAALAVDSGFTNAGTIELTGTSWGGLLTVSGTLVNEPGGVLRILSGAGSTLNGTLDNRGAIEVDGPWTLNGASAAHLNSGSIVLGTGNWTLTQSGTSPRFTTTGTVRVGAGRTWSVSGGSLAYANASPGGLTGRGTIALSGVTLSLTPTLIHDTLALGLTNSVVNGPGALAVAGATPLMMSASTINTLLVIQGTLQANPGVNTMTGSVAVQAGGTLRLMGNNGPALLSVIQAFANEGTIELTGTSWGGQLTTPILSLQPTGVLRVLNGAGNTLTGALASIGTVEVQGPFTVNGVSAIHTNNGTINVASGSLTVSQSGTTPSFTNNGIMQVAAGQVVTVSGGDFVNSQSGTLSGSGTVNAATTTFTHEGVITPGVSAGTLTLAGTYAPASSAILSVEIGGTAPGTQYDQLNVTGTATLNGTLDVTLIGGFVPALGDTFTVVTGSSLSGSFSALNLPVVAGASWVPLSIGMTFRLALVSSSQAAVKLWSNALGGNWSLASNWQPLGVPAAGDSVVIDLAGTYTVTVDQTATAQYLTLGTSVGGGIRTLAVPSSALTLGNGATVGAEGVVDLSGGTLTGGGSVVIDGTMNWTGGTVSGAGITTIGATGTLNLSGSTSLVSRTLVNQGTMIWAGGTLAGTSTLIQNAGLFDIPGDGTVSWAGGTQPSVENLSGGTMQRRSSSNFVTFNVPFTNHGTVDVQAGILLMQQGGASTGDFTVQPGAVLRFGGATFALGDGTDLSGAGLVELTAGVLDIAAADTVTATRLHQRGGTIAGVGVLRPDSLVWTSGAQSGPGGLHIATGATLRVNGAITWNRSIVNDGTILWAGGTIGGGSVTLQNNGLFDAQANASMLWAAGGVPPVFDNTASGSVLRRVGAGAAIMDVVVNHAGVFDVQSGRMELMRGGAATADFTVQPGMTLEFASGTYAMNTGADFAGSGLVELTNAVLDIAAADTVRAPRMHQLGGTLTGAGVFQPDSLVWTSGTQSGTGVTLIAAGATLVINGTVSLQRQLVNLGSVSWAGGTIGGGAQTFRNAGVFNVQVDNGSFTWSTGATPHLVDNQPSGTVLRTGTGTVALDVTLNNLGVVDVQKGALSVDRGGTSTGFWNVADPAAVLDFGGGAHILDDGTKINGQGLVSVSGAAVTIKGAGSSYDVAGVTQITSGSLDFSMPDTARMTVLQLRGGVLAGTAPLLVRAGGDASWTGGTLQGPSGSALVIPSSVTLTLGLATQKVLDGRTVLSFGTVNWTGGGVQAQRAGTLDVQPSAAFTVSSPGSWAGAGSGEVIHVRDRATMNVTTQGATGLGPSLVFSNQGTLDVAAGATLKVSADFNQLAGSTLQGNGTLDVASAPKVVNQGTTRPGTSPGILRIVGNWSQGVGTTLVIDVAGITPGTEHDQLIVTGQLTTGGTLVLSGAPPPPTGILTIVQYGSRAGQDFPFPPTLIGGIGPPRAVTYNQSTITVNW